MKVYKDCEVLYLTEDDLVGLSTLKAFEDVTLFDFRMGSREIIYKASVIIFTMNGKYRVLKSRY